MRRAMVPRGTRDEARSIVDGGANSHDLPEGVKDRAGVIVGKPPLPACSWSHTITIQHCAGSGTRHCIFGDGRRAMAEKMEFTGG